MVYQVFRSNLLQNLKSKMAKSKDVGSNGESRPWSPPARRPPRAPRPPRGPRKAEVEPTETRWTPRSSLLKQTTHGSSSRTHSQPFQFEVAVTAGPCHQRVVQDGSKRQLLLHLATVTATTRVASTQQKHRQWLTGTQTTALAPGCCYR